MPCLDYASRTVRTNKQTISFWRDASPWNILNPDMKYEQLYANLSVKDTYRRRQMQRTVTRQMSFDLTKLLVTEDWFCDISPQTMRRLLNIVSITGKDRITLWFRTLNVVIFYLNLKVNLTVFFFRGLGLNWCKNTIIRQRILSRSG